MLDDGFDWLADELNEHAGVAATLQRGVHTTSLTVVSQGSRPVMTKLGDSPDETVYAMQPPEQGYCGFTVKVSDYVINGQAVKPARGDKLIIGAKQFWVTAPDGEQFFEYVPNEESAKWFLLHTQLNA